MPSDVKAVCSLLAEISSVVGSAIFRLASAVLDAVSTVVPAAVRVGRAVAAYAEGATIPASATAAAMAARTALDRMVIGPRRRSSTTTLNFEM